MTLQERIQKAKNELKDKPIGSKLEITDKDDFKIIIEKLWK